METLFIYLLKSSGLSYFVLSGLLFFLRKKPFQVTVGFVGRFDHFRHSAFIGFHEDRLGGTNPATIDWSQIPLVFLEKPL
jgi:hypothetical protein